MKTKSVHSRLLIVVLALMALALFPADGFSSNSAFVGKTIGSRRRNHQSCFLKAIHDRDLPSDVTDKSCQISRRSWFRRSSLTFVASNEIISKMFRGDVAYAMDDVDENPLCDLTVSAFRKGDRIVYLIGTAHISEDSAKLVGKVVRKVQPNAVFVELDAKRVKMGMKNSNEEDVEAVKRKSDELDPPPSISNKKAKLFDLKGKATEAAGQAVGKAISGLYKKLEAQGFSAGEEFSIAIKEGLALNPPATIILGDRDVDVTLQHLSSALSKTDLKQLLLASESAELQNKLPENVKQKVDAGGELDKDQMTVLVETLKQRDTVKLLMRQLQQNAPEVYMAMVGERDIFMAEGLDKLSTMKCTVAVMGLAHVDGVERTLGQFGWKNDLDNCPIKITT